MEAAHKKCTRGEERGQTSRIFCSKAKFPTNISAEKEFLRRQRINQAMMKGRREKGGELAWIFPRELLGARAYFDSCIKFAGVIKGVLSGYGAILK